MWEKFINKLSDFGAALLGRHQLIKREQQVYRKLVRK